MAIKSFDRYFYNLPEFTKEEDFEKFWEKSIAEIKKIPIDPELHESHKKSTAKFKAYDISYNGFLKTRRDLQIDSNFGKSTKKQSGFTAKCKFSI